MSSPSTPQRMGWPAWVFAVTVFLGAALLFLLEPVTGKSLLPWYGGTPAVWNTCVFFFQGALLLGYFYAHLLQRWPIRRQVAVHVALLAAALLLLLPIRFHVAGLTGPAQNPTATVLLDLAKSVGLIFFLLSTTAPLLQAWYAAARLPGNPYLFYLASNAGSFLSLLIYPTLVEWWWPLSGQYQGLSWAFAGFVVLTVLSGVLALVRKPVSGSLDTAARGIAPAAVGWRDRGLWLLLAMCPSSLMLGVTTYLSTEIAPLPAIWILPLGLYLLTFIIAFSQPPGWIITASALAFPGLSLIVAVSGQQPPYGELISVALHAGVLFTGALALHGRLAALQPDVRHLTEYYLWISIGGLAGSVFNTLLAPALFNWLAEYPLAIVAGLSLVPWPRPQQRWRRTSLRVVRVAVAAIVLAGFARETYFSASSRFVLLRERTFFGAFQVTRGRQGVMHQLVHGRTVHGMQIASQNPRERRPPLTYYFFTGPIGQAILGYRGTPTTQSVGVVGLGVGSLASYAEAGESYTFYEIDPAIDRVAQDERYFTFLSDARARGAKTRVVLGDARLRLREAKDGEFGLLVLDAFTSDAIPVHLLTKDAWQEYATKLNAQGVLAFHISNLYIDLEPVLANIAADLNWTAYVQHDDHPSPEELRRGKSPSKWLIVSTDANHLQPMIDSGRWRPCRTRPELGVWTDDQSNVLSALNWARRPRSEF